MMAWIVKALQFLPICYVVSVVCVSMKEDRVPVILLKAVRFCGVLTAVTVLFSLAIYGVIVVFL
jgi:hypothetical protein